MQQQQQQQQDERGFSDGDPQQQQQHPLLSLVSGPPAMPFSTTTVAQMKFQIEELEREVCQLKEQLMWSRTENKDMKRKLSVLTRGKK